MRRKKHIKIILFALALMLALLGLAAEGLCTENAGKAGYFKGEREGGKLVSNNEGQLKRCPSCILLKKIKL